MERSPEPRPRHMIRIFQWRNITQSLPQLWFKTRPEEEEGNVTNGSEDSIDNLNPNQLVQQKSHCGIVQGGQQNEAAGNPPPLAHKMFQWQWRTHRRTTLSAACPLQAAERTGASWTRVRHTPAREFSHPHVPGSSECCQWCTKTAASMAILVWYGHPPIASDRLTLELQSYVRMQHSAIADIAWARLRVRVWHVSLATGSERSCARS